MPENSGGLSGQAAIDAGTAAIAGVDATEESVQEAIEAIEDGSVGVVGETFTLTAEVAGVQTGIDDIDGTAGNDTFRAVTDDALDTTDIINGSGGDDVLNIADDSVASAVTAPVITGVERINNSEDTNTLDLADVTGLEELWSRGAATYANAGLGVTFGLENLDTSGGTVTVTAGLTADTDLSGDEDAVNVALNSNDATNAIDLQLNDSTGADARADIEVLNVTSIDAGGDLDVSGYTGLTEVNVMGAGAVQLSFDGAGTSDALEAVNAAEATGDVTVVLDANDTITTITTGSGEDGVTLAGQVDATVDLGAGDDTLNVAGTETGLSVTGGADNDVHTFASIDNIADASEGEFEADIIEITDFDAAEDFLDVSASGYAQQTITTTQQGEIDDSDSLFDAVTYVAENIADTANDLAVFDYQGDTYLFTQGTSAVAGPPAVPAGFGDDDGLVKLTGVAESDLDAGVNFVA